LQVCIPVIASCAALRHVLSSKLQRRSPITTLLRSTTRCHVPVLLHLGTSTPVEEPHCSPQWNAAHSHSCGSPWTPPLRQARSGTLPSGSSGPAQRSCSRRCTPMAAFDGQGSTPEPPPPLAPPHQQRTSGTAVEPPPRENSRQSPLIIPPKDSSNESLPNIQ